MISPSGFSSGTRPLIRRTRRLPTQNLFTLVHRIYAEAQAPLVKQMSAAMALSSPFIEKMLVPEPLVGRIEKAEAVLAALRVEVAAANTGPRKVRRAHQEDQP